MNHSVKAIWSTAAGLCPRICQRGLRARRTLSEMFFFAMAMGAGNFTETNQDETSFLDFGGSSSAVAV
jgi:hypothetical protein